MAGSDQSGPEEQASCLCCGMPSLVLIGELKPGEAALCLACAWAVDHADPAEERP